MSKLTQQEKDDVLSSVKNHASMFRNAVRAELGIEHPDLDRILTAIKKQEEKEFARLREWHKIYDELEKRIR